MNFKTQEIKRIIIKSPLIPLFQRGKYYLLPLEKGGREGFSKR